MTDKQPEALRLAEMMEDGRWQGMNDSLAAAELRRLHEVNAELVEALKHYVNVVVSVNEPDSWEPKVADGGGIARKAIAKAQGENNANG